MFINKQFQNDKLLLEQLHIAHVIKLYQEHGKVK